MPASFTGTYTQSFDSLAATGSGISWTNDLTLSGWYLFRQPAATPIALTAYNADTGASTSGAFVSYGASASSERALGGLASGGSYYGSPASGAVAGWFALALSNASGSAISSLNLSFNGEQWRNGGNATPQTMVLEYGYGTSFDQVTSWVAPGANFNWSSPVATATAAAVDGNGAGRLTACGGSLNLSANPWAAGSTLWLRWVETNDSGNDHGLAIDDLAISLPLPPAQLELTLQALDATAVESGDGALLRLSRSGSTAAELVVPISLVAGPGLASAADLSSQLPASLTIPVGAASVDLAIDLLDDILDEGTETLRLQITAPAGTTLAASGASVDLTLLDNDRISLISAVQGSGASSPLLDQSVTLRAVVVGDFQLSGELGGFFLQEESGDWDSSALSSEALYVAYPLSGSNSNVALGDRVLVSGLAGERFGQTVITSVSALSVEAHGRLSDTRRLDIPDLLAQRNASLDLEPYEGMWVRFPETLSVNGLYGQFRFGEIELSADGLPQQPTNVIEPGAAAYTAEQATARRELVLDDGSNSSYRPASAATAAAPVRDQLLRRGDAITAVEGVLAYDFSKYRLHPTAPLSFLSANPRPAEPAAPAAGQIRLASFNVLNTFTTLNVAGALTDSGQPPRGANSAEELERQLSKLTVALVGLKADVIGLMELENDADDATLAAIVQRLNAAQPIGSGRSYSFVPTGLIGTDAIKVGLIYNNLAVAPSGAAQVLNSQAFVDPLASGTAKNRPALAQAFRELATSEIVNVVVNHLKSKGATDATGADLDQLDGQAAYNATRTAAAARLLDWIATAPTGNSDRDWVILGDLNAYAKEDPIRVIEAAGYRNVLPTFTAEPPSSYAFYNPVDMSGALDHMLISASLVPQASSALDWTINGAEGAFRDYNLDSNSNGNGSVRDFFAADPFRTSDHDPLLLDLDLGRALPVGLAFAHGVASGDPYADSVILWTRLTPPDGFDGLLDVQWELASSADFAPGSIRGSGVFATSAGRDWTVKVEADGLSADTSYYYRFRAGDAVSMVGQTKTLPLGSDPVRLAVFSCANFTAAERFAAYGRAAAIHALNPYDALLHLGDYIYEYGPAGYGTAEDAAAERGFLPNREIIALDDYRQRYAQYHTDSNLQNLRAIAPLIAGWDDHETANNSWSGGAQNHQSETEGDWTSRRDAALQAYYEWLPIREPGQRQASDDASALSPLSQAYRSFSFGDVLSLHMLETRLTARDEQLAYPDAAAVQTRIAAILADPAQVAAYAVQLGLTPPADPAVTSAFAAALAPAVTLELVLATVQKAWGDTGRDMIGDGQLAWLQQQLASSSASWQLLGQQTLMQSMAVPAELLLNAADPSLLDKYAAPLQKLATGTAFADLTPAEQALFDEAGKIPYNLDAWDGYGVERETILQSALALGKRLISLAGDTHNAWAGVLDTMAPGNRPAGTVAGVEFATPGVTSPGLERVLPSADAYIRAVYPAVDGLDGLFKGYVNGLSYADTNRRGFLDLTLTPQHVVGNFQFLNGVNSHSAPGQWSSEGVVVSSDLSISLQPEALPVIRWQPGWHELDLVLAMAVDISAGQVLLSPSDYTTLPRSGVQLADVTVQGSDAGDRIFAGVGSLIDAAGGSDDLFNTDSQGENLLIGGADADQMFLIPLSDQVIGGRLLRNAPVFGSGTIAEADRKPDRFFIDSSSVDATSGGPLRILDFERGLDVLLLDGQSPMGDWSSLRTQLQALNISINTVPELKQIPAAITLKQAQEVVVDLGQAVRDDDGDSLQIIILDGPDWIRTSGTVLRATAPANFSKSDLDDLVLSLGLYDGTAVTPYQQPLTLNLPPSSVTLTPTTPLPENTATSTALKLADIVVADDAIGSVLLALSGEDTGSFFIKDNQIFLGVGVNLDYELKSSYQVVISAQDPDLVGGAPLTTELNLQILDVNEPPSSLSLINRVDAIDEQPPLAERLRIADLVIEDDALGSVVVSIAGPDSSSFEIIDQSLYLRPGVRIDHESKSLYRVSLTVLDPELPASKPLFQELELAVRDINEPATSVRLVNRITSLPDTISTATPLRLADLVISDDRLGNNVPLLSGQDASLFEIRDGSLFLRQGAALDASVQSNYRLKIILDDRDIADSTEQANAFFELEITPGLKRERGQLDLTLQTELGGRRQIPITFAGGDLLPSSTVQILSDFTLQQGVRQKLDDQRVTLSDKSIDFSLSLTPGLTSAALNSSLELVGSDLLASLSDTAGRIPSRQLLYYAYDSLGQISPLSFDPIQGAGARFYDLSGNGVPDFFSLALIDGGYGDKDGAVNGVLDDPSFAAYADIHAGFSQAAGGFLSVVDSASPLLPASVALRVDISSRTQVSTNIYYIVLNQSELADSGAVVDDIESLRGRARLLVSTLESTDITLPSNVDFRREFLMLNGQAVRLFEVADVSLAEISTINDSRLRFLDAASVTEKESQYTSPSGIALDLSLVDGDQGLNALVGQQQSQAPVLDFTAFRTSQSVQGSVSFAREAMYDSVTGFYRCLDVSGAVRASDGITIVRPGDPNYQAEALRLDNIIDAISSLQVANRQTSSRSFALNESSVAAPFAKVNDDTYFAYSAANADGVSHFRSLGTNLIGLEDLFGGGDLDFDDLVFGFDFARVL